MVMGNTPATVGVPERVAESVPPVKVTPLGSAPDSEIVGSSGAPVAEMANENASLIGTVSVDAVVNAGDAAALTRSVKICETEPAPFCAPIVNV
jgi:hypothetical protein